MSRYASSNSKGEGKLEHLYSALQSTNHSKALRHGSHSLTCKEHHASIYIVSAHQMAPPLNVAADISLQPTTHLSPPRE